MYHGPLRHGRDRTCFCGYIGDKILSNTCNKLVYLHINPLTMRKCKNWFVFAVCEKKWGCLHIYWIVEEYDYSFLVQIKKLFFIAQNMYSHDK